MNFWQLMQISAPVYMVLFVGFLARKMRLLEVGADRTLLRLALNVLMPCLVLNLTIGNEAMREVKNLLYPPVFGVLSVILGYGVSWLVGALGGVRESSLRTFVFSCGLQNYGYIALPITLALFGRDVAAVSFGFFLGVEIGFWGLGISILSGQKGWRVFRGMLTPPLIGIVCGVFLNFLGAGEWMPLWIERSLGMLGGCAIPCALLLTGAFFADHSRWEQIVNGKRIAFFGIIVRLGLMPLILLGIARWVPMDDALRSILVVQAAMPAAVAPLVITRLYDGDMAVAFKVIFVTNILGLMTIPFWLAVGLAWFGG